MTKGVRIRRRKLDDSNTGSQGQPIASELVNSQGRCAKRRRRGTWRGGRGADQPLPSSSRYDLYALYARCVCSSMRHHHARTRGGWVDNMKECAFTHIYARLYARSVSPLPLFGSGCNRQPALWPVRAVSVAERPFDRSRPCDLVRAARRRFPHGIKSFGAFFLKSNLLNRPN